MAARDRVERVGGDNVVEVYRETLPALLVLAKRINLSQLSFFTYPFDVQREGEAESGSRKGGPMKVDMHEAKSRLYRLARLIREGKAQRKPGGLEGQIVMGPDFDEDDDEITAAFEGSRRTDSPRGSSDDPDLK